MTRLAAARRLRGRADLGAALSAALALLAAAGATGCSDQKARGASGPDTATVVADAAGGAAGGATGGENGGKDGGEDGGASIERPPVVTDAAREPASVPEVRHDGSAPAACTSKVPTTPAPASHWVDATGNLAGMPAGCAAMAQVAAVPCSTRVLAGVEGHGLWASDDLGKSWQAQGTGAGSAAITNAVNGILFDPADPRVFWETGIRGTNGLYVTHDGGGTFAALGTMTFTQYVSVDFGDPARRTLLTGTHGMKQQVWRSLDGGASWTNVGLALPAAANNAESPLVLDANTFLIGVCGSGPGDCGIYRTTDAGTTWTVASTARTSHYGGPLHASDGAIYWPLTEGGGIVKSSDGGVTFGPPTGAGASLGLTPVELPDHSIVTVGNSHLMQSTDGARTWTPILDPLPFQLTVFDTATVTYSAGARAFFLSHFDCGANRVVAGELQSAGFDVAVKN